MRRRLLAVAVVAAALAFVPAGAAVPGGPVLGPQRILVALVTWGPTPFTHDEVGQVFAATDAFYRKMSYGKASLTPTVTPWLRAFDTAPACVTNSIRDRAAAAARAAGYDPSVYDVVVYVHPEIGCAWSGVTHAGTVFLNGELTTHLLAHELGHAFGLPHANATMCIRHSCAALEYGDPYDTMGGGDGDFSAYAKAQLGWITHVTRAVRDGAYVIDALERPSQRSQALVITTAQDSYWIEYRSEGTKAAAAGIVLHVSPSPDLHSLSNTYNALVTDPAKRGRPELLVGDRFTYPGVFRLAVVSTAAGARLRFKWLDATPPAVPRVESTVVAGQVRVEIEATRERGSGVARYDVSLDGRAALSLGNDATDAPVVVGRPLPGTHRIRVVAVDRAGNRSVPAVKRIRIP